MNASFAFTLAFAAALLIGLLLKFWLASRQIRHVALHRGAVPPAFADTVTLEAHQKAADYTIAKSRLSLLELAWDAAVLLGWTLLGGLDLANRLLLDALGPGMLQQIALFVVFGVVTSLLDLPFTLWQTFRLEERFGFNKMTWRLWLADLVRNTLVSLVLGLPLLWAVLWLMQASGSLWWLYAWAATSAYLLFVMWIGPRVIMPLYNKFTPLDDQALAQRATALMQRAGFQASGFFVMDGSRRSAHSNAFFTGFGANKRVVFFDTLLERLNHGEMEAVLAHELGHFKHRHIVKRMAMMFAMNLAAFALLGWLASQAWFYTGLGVRPSMAGSNDALALLLFALAVPVFTFFVAPLAARRSRRDEFEADAYAVAQTSGADLSAALLKLYKDNASTLTPDPVFARFYYSHPPASERLARMAAVG